MLFGKIPAVSNTCIAVRLLSTICFLISLLWLSGCTDTETPLNTPASIYDTKWMLKELGEHPDITSEKNVFIQFLSEDRKLIGNSGCNNFFGQYEINNDLLSITNLGSTKMMCPDMTIEDAFLQFLPKVQRYEVNGAVLILYGENGKFATFESSPSFSTTQVDTLTAAQSDPKVMGWMQGFPPAKDKLITQPDSNYFSFPKLRWSVCHLREFLPTEEISRGIQAPMPLDYVSPADFADLRQKIDAIAFTPMRSNQTMTWEQSLYENYTDGMLIIHKNQVVYERYFGCLQEDGKHAAMSMTKSITGLLAEILVVNNQLDENALVKNIIPEIRDSAFADATVRQVMDMTTGVKYSENYADPNADIWLYSAAASPLPKPADYVGPNGYWEYLQQVKRDGEHGQEFHYKTINSDMLGWIVSRVTGKSITQLTSDVLWRPMGAEQSAYQTVDGKGVPFAGGGLTAGLRDLGRIGLLMLNNGQINGKQLFAPQVVANIRKGGDKQKFGDGFPTLKGGSYTSQWWVFHNEHQAFAARGVHGQTIYVDPTADMVLVRFASYPKAQNGFIDPTSLPAYDAVAKYLMAHR
jgi:CubicO group peptidase (beta-lactamase class C family)/heat shock protein HslJ